MPIGFFGSNKVSEKSVKISYSMAFFVEAYIVRISAIPRQSKQISNGPKLLKLLKLHTEVIQHINCIPRHIKLMINKPQLLILVSQKCQWKSFGISAL